MFQFRLIELTMWRRYLLAVEEAGAVLDGTPAWRIYQSRLLGPWTVELLEPVFGSFLAAHVAFTIGATAVAGLLVLHLGRRLHGGWAPALAGFAVLHLLLAFSVSRRWVYAWDSYGLIFFTVFVYLALKGARTRAFVVLFAAALLNRESASAVAIYLIASPIVARLFGDRLDMGRLVTGAGLFVVGFVAVEAARNALLVHERLGPGDISELIDYGQGLHLTWWLNLDDVIRTVTEWDYQLPFLLPLIPVAWLAWAVSLVVRDPRRHGALVLAHLALLVAILLFGLVMEPRLYWELFPLVALTVPSFPGAPRCS